MFAEHPRVFNKKILKTPEWKISISNFATNSFFKARHTFYDPVIGTFLFLQVRSMEAETKQENKKNHSIILSLMVRDQVRPTEEVTLWQPRAVI